MCFLFSIKSIREMLEKVRGWHFLELEIINLFKEAYLLNEKISHEDQKEIYQFFAGPLSKFIEDFIERSS
jgi:hypothetical protein